jgi:hypothetical protein
MVVGNDETTLVKNDRQLTVDNHDSVVIGGTHDKVVTGPVTQNYGGDHSRKVDGQQEFFAEKNKDEHVKLARRVIGPEPSPRVIHPESEPSPRVIHPNPYPRTLTEGNHKKFQFIPNPTEGNHKKFPRSFRTLTEGNHKKSRG